MPIPSRSIPRWTSPLLVVLAACAPRTRVPDLPADPWRQYADPSEAGFDAGALDAVCDYADSVGSAAVMALQRGHVVLACGAIDRELEAHSVRKSLVSGLYGTAVARGEIDLDATLAELGIDDTPPLTAAEKAATVRDLIAARSGVYLGAAYAPASQDRDRPGRGNHAPGTHWFYNNWDFNVAGVVYERATGEDLYESFGRRIAEPIGMQDYDPGDGFVVYEPTESRHPAHTFRISARDLARFGQLYLQEGRWNGRQVVPAGWIAESTRPVTRFEDGDGYGYMWWTYRAGSAPASIPHIGRYDTYMARGTGSQALWVIPEAGLVIVHRADTDHGRSIAGRDAWAIADGIVAARTGEPVSDPALVAVDVRPFDSQLPEHEWPEAIAVEESRLDDYMGRYPVSEDAVIRVFRFRGEPYIHVPGEGDALLIPVAPDAFTVRVVPGV
ncbi:MAG: serine hydrolase, partial [Gemmatimonadetes bacterium]|nr:serine hydrolase [Gemmatimonadota bacterium]NIQ52840.1 serine hydrolase [Gemmatimonadota bacterium]NIU72970.1 serine hydrolase [Gammaproteobacteria bacterium]NIX43325.1 serine hydrolase [Gemmatimonadota bacterium]NIY07495.1 serine hydrolase [Gemmatimonadota bacterium]